MRLERVRHALPPKMNPGAAFGANQFTGNKPPYQTLSLFRAKMEHMGNRVKPKSVNLLRLAQTADPLALLIKAVGTSFPSLKVARN